jgi:hypothetical protein
MYWILVISMFSPGGELIREYREGPIESRKECVARTKEFKATPDLYGILMKAHCIKDKQ